MITALVIFTCVVLLGLTIQLMRMALLTSQIAKLMGSLAISADLRNGGELLKNEGLQVQIHTARIVRDMLLVEQAARHHRPGAN